MVNEQNLIPKLGHKYNAYQEAQEEPQNKDLNPKPADKNHLQLNQEFPTLKSNNAAELTVSSIEQQIYQPRQSRYQTSHHFTEVPIKNLEIEKLAKEKGGNLLKKTLVKAQKKVVPLSPFASIQQRPNFASISGLSVNSVKSKTQKSHNSKNEYEKHTPDRNFSGQTSIIQVKTTNSNQRFHI